MATTPAATPHSDSPSYPDPGVHALGVVACAMRCYGMGAGVMIGVKKKRSSEHGLCCQGVVFYGFGWTKGR